MLKFTVFIISVIFLNCINTAPLSGNEEGCKKQCPTTSKGNKLNYQAGQVYKYTFDSNIAISLTGNDPQDVQLQVQGLAHVHGLTADCQYGLNLQDVTVSGNGKRKFSNKDQLTKMVQFTLSNDKLSPEICTHSSESDVSLNIKRALISMFQLSDTSTEETDVFGTCYTNYAVTKQDDGSYVVTKSRDLNSCNHRETFVNGFVTGVFNEESNVRSTPILNGDYTNEVRVNKNGVIESSQITEDYQLVPFSNGEAGVRVRVSTTFRFKEQKANAGEQSSVSISRPLTYEISGKPNADNFKLAKKSLLDICQTYAQRKNSVGPQIAGQFTETIRLLRLLSKDDILLLHKEASQLKDQPICRKVFLDAVFRVATADSVNAVASLLDNGKIVEKRLAYLSFNLARSVNKDTIVILTKLLDKENLKEAYLSIGNLVKKYTKSHSTENDPELKKLFNKLAEKLGDGKPEKRHQEDIHVAILKGLRNAKGVTGALMNKLIEKSAESQPGRIRAAAIQAFGSSCDDAVRNAAFNILKNRQDDSEFRIEAYLSLVQCSTPSIAIEVGKILEDEPVHQVGSFIKTHLSNLRSSTDLYREKARQDFADVYVSKEFPMDIRKFSFNNEVSYEFGSLGLGGSTDTNVIYSQKSFIPRSARTNITGELFGTSFNLFELDARQENLELVLERYFGAKGFFNSLNKQEAVNKFQSLVTNEKQHKHKRAIQDDATKFGQDNLGNFDRDLDFDLSVKMFGSELYFLSLGDNVPTEAKGFINLFTRWFENFLKNTKEGKTNNFDMHSLFLDAELSYPTSIGLPLKIHSQGAGAFHLETTFKADLKEIKMNPKSTKFAINLTPSFNVELTGIVSVDAWELTTGVKVSSNIHSSTGSMLSFELLNGGKGVDVKIDFPFTKQEIISLNHKIAFFGHFLGQEAVQYELKSALKKDTTGRSDCFDQFHKYLGITVCYDLSHNPFKKVEKLFNSRLFPLNSPAHLTAYVQIDKQYHFRAAYDDTIEGKHTLSMIFDTPQSESQRTIDIKIEASRIPKLYLSASINSPYKNFQGEIGINNNENELTLYGTANSDADQYRAKFGFKKSGSAQHREYTPIVELTNPNAVPYKVGGRMIAETNAPKVKYIFEKLSIEPLSADGRFGPLVLDGWFEYNKAEHYATSLDIKYKNKSGKFNGKLALKSNEVEFDASILSDFSDYLNGKVYTRQIRGDNHFLNSFVLVYGKDLESTTKRIEITNDFQYEKDDKKYKSITGKNLINIGVIPIKIKVHGSIRKNHVDYEFSAASSKYAVGSDLSADYSSKSKGDWKVEFDMSANKHKLEFKSVRDIDEAGQKSVVTNDVKTSFGTDIEFNVKFDNELSREKADIVADGKIVLVKGQKPLSIEYKLSVIPKHAETSGKIVADTTELVKFDAVLNRNGGDSNTPTTGTFELNIHDILAASGNYNSLKGEGKSDLVITIARLERKIKVETKYSHAANKFDLRNDFYYNFEKDDSRHIAFDTKNKYTSTSFDSINEIDIDSHKLQFNIEANGSGDFKKGKHNGKFLLRLPTQREITGSLERDVDFSAPKATGQGVFKLTDKLANAGGKSRSAQLEFSLKDGCWESRLFDMSHKLTLTDFEGKDIIISAHDKHLPKGQFKMFDSSLKIAGSRVPNPVELNFGIDEYCAIHAVFHASTKYGDSFNVGLNGDYALGESGTKPTTFKLSGDVSIPNTKLKHLSFNTRGSAKSPDSKDANSQYEYDLKFNGKMNEKDLDFEANGKANRYQGDLSLAGKVPEIEPFALDMGYTLKNEGESKHATGNVQVRYGNGKNIKISGDSKIILNKEISLTASISTPYEKAKNVDASIKILKKDDETYATEIELNADNKKYKYTDVVVVSRINPSITIDVYYPQDGHSQVAASLTRTNDRRYKTSLRLINLNGFHLSGDAELSYQSIENFGLTIDLDSQSLKANELHIDIHTKQSGNNKGIEFTANEAGKNIISGTADYAIKEEKGKTTIDGKGSVNWYDQSNAVTFQILKNTFDQQRNNETGVMLVFTGQIGQRNINAQLKVTNKEFHIRHTICEPGSQCMNIDISSSLTDVDWRHFTHNLLVTIDLRKLGFKHEFNLKSDTKREGFLIYHTFDTHILSAEQNKYQYKGYVTPDSAGIELSTPKRSSAVEATFTYPKSIFGTYKATIVSYLDKKNSPNKKSIISFDADIKRDNEYKYIASGSITAGHPSVKELRVSGKTVFDGNKHSIGGEMTFDVFKNTNQAIVVVAKYSNSDKSLKGFNITSELSLKSQGLGLDYAFNGNAGVSYTQRAYSFSSELTGPTAKERFALYLLGDGKSVDFSWIIFNDELLKASGNLDTAKKEAVLRSNVRLLGSDSIDSLVSLAPKRFHAEIKHGNFLSLETEASSGSANLKILGNQKRLLNVDLAFDQTNLLSTDYNVDDKEFKEFLKSAKTKLIEGGKKAREEFESRLSHAKQSLTTQVNGITNSLPDFSKLSADYKEEFEKFTEDLLSDKSIKEFVELFKKTYELLNKTVGEILRTLVLHIGKISKTITDLFKHLYDGFNERILPSIKESWSHIEQSLMNLYDEVINVATHLFQRLVESLKKFEEDFKRINKTAAEWFKKISKAFTEQVVIIQKELEDLYKLIVDYIKAFPGVEAVKDKYNEFITNLVVPENIVNSLKELSETLKHAIQVKEINELISSIINYIELKVQKKQINDVDELKKIVEKALIAIRSLLNLAKNQLQSYGISSSDEYFGLPIPSLQKLQFIPHLSTLKFSVWNYILHEPFPSLKNILLAYRPHAFNPFNAIPPFLIEGRVIDGEYLFTFGGNQITVPGSCHYVLAKDIFDGNFTVVAHIANKQLQSIGIVDKSGDGIEVNSNGKLTINDKAGDFPVQEKTLFAWRTWHSINILTTYGAHVVCFANLKACQLFVNGFYHGKLRGLLGIGGYEIYDELTLPNGKLASSSTEFVNTYKLPSHNCPNVNMNDQHKHDVDDAKSSECDRVFGIQSPTIRFAGLILDASKWISACQHAVKNAANKQEAACNIAQGFVAYAHSENIPAYVPSICLKCEVTDDTGAVKAYTLGETYTTPIGKKADIVFVVDTAIEGKHLTELMNHFITQLRHSLKKDYDTHIAIVGYKKGDKYPSHYTFDGKLDITKFHLAKKPENAPHDDKLLTTGCEYIDPILRKMYNYTVQIKEDLSLSADGNAFREALGYPFRSNANKAIIAVRSDILKHSSNPLKSLAARGVNELSKTLGVSIHMLAPTPELKFDNNRDAKSVVGFNDKTVLFMPGQKARGQDRQHIHYGDDLGIDLVQKGYGYTFSLTNYDSLDAQNQKQYLKVAASAIAAQMTKTESESECLCALHKGLVPREICRESKKSNKSSRK